MFVLSIELPFWVILLIFLLGILPGIFIGWFLCSISRLGEAPKS